MGSSSFQKGQVLTEGKHYQTVISVDLAARRYRDIGIAVLRGSEVEADVMLLQPEEIGLVGVPVAALLAKTLKGLAIEKAADLILMDGPQGWRASESAIKHTSGGRS